MRDAAQEVSAKIGMGGTVLALRPMPGAVGQDRFQLVIDRTADVESVVHHDATQLLAHALSHESAFLKMDVEAFLSGDYGHYNLETTGGSFELFVT